MKKTLLSIVAMATIGFSSTAQNVTIPDANFKAHLVANDLIDTNFDDEIQVTEANAFTGEISCLSLGITDITGIEAFTALTSLKCGYNAITSMNLSQNSNLETLRFGGNNISGFFDFSHNPNLTYLDFVGNDITSIDLSQNSALTYLSCNNNMLNTLDISQNSAITFLFCDYNNISVLDLSQNTTLQQIYCAGNNIEFLDISQNTGCTDLECYNNDLTVMDMRNISTAVMIEFHASSNPNLTCIEVDDVAAATAAWTDKDPASSFSLNCITLVNSITVSGQAGATLITTNGGTLQMVADVLPAHADDDTYTWSVTDGTGSASIDASGVLTAITNGMVTVTATANDASGTIGDAVITISNQSSAGINDQAALNNVIVYPNPAKSSITIDSETEVKSIVFINLMGEKVKTIVAPASTVDVSDLAKGVYLLQIYFENTLVNQRLIKE